jgi:hypothetical protein
MKRSIFFMFAVVVCSTALWSQDHVNFSSPEPDATKMIILEPVKHEPNETERFIRDDTNIILQYSGEPTMMYVPPAPLTVACRWDADDLTNLGVESGMTITSVDIVAAASNHQIAIKIWQGGSWPQGPEIELYSQHLDNAQYGWTPIILDRPVVIDASQMLWIGYQNISTEQIGYGSSAGPTASNTYSDCFSFGYEWLSGGFNWCIRANINAICEPVSDLTSQQTDNKTVLLTWDDSSLPIDSFRVYRNDTLMVNTANSFYLDENLPPGEYEYYVVTCYNTGCVSGSSNHIIEIIEEETCEPINDLTAEKINNHSILLTWTKPEESLEVEGYNVFRNDIPLTTTLITATSYLDENLPVGEYEYYVTAHYTDDWVSDESNHVKETITLGIEAPPSPPKGRDVRVYPNPTDGVLNLIQDPVSSSKFKVTGIEIFDIMGRKHEGEKFPSFGGVRGGFDISHLPAGIYFLRIVTDNGVIIQKIIKN